MQEVKSRVFFSVFSTYNFLDSHVLCSTNRINRNRVAAAGFLVFERLNIFLGLCCPRCRGGWELTAGHPNSLASHRVGRGRESGTGVISPQPKQS